MSASIRSHDPPAVESEPRILIGASIPRSGHHFLVEMMKGYFGGDLFYCEFYSQADCCKAVPCTRGGDRKFVFQKSHDRDFALPGDIADALYLIQYRHPVPEALSDRELELKGTLGRPNLNFRRTRAGYSNWLAAKAVYYRKFHEKWLAKRLANAVYLDYADLVANPLDALKPVVERIAGCVDEARLADIVEMTRSSRASVARKDAQEQPFRPRVIADSPHFDAELLGAFEAWVLERCPGYDFARELSGSYENSAVYAMILLRDANEPLPKGETKRFMAAAKRAPDHPEILRRLALKSIRDGHVAQGISGLEDLLVRHPYFAAGYGLLFSVCADSGTAIPESVLNGNGLIACSENAELSFALGRAFLEKGFAMNAVAAFSLATVLAPQRRDARERLAAAIAAARK